MEDLKVGGPILEPSASAKRPYERPMLEELGSLRELTLGGANPGNPDVVMLGGGTIGP